MPIRRPGIPSIDPAVDPRIRPVLLALKENAEIANGVRTGTNANQDGWKRRSVTLEMLVKLGVITEQEARSIYQEL